MEIVQKIVAVVDAVMDPVLAARMQLGPFTRALVMPGKIAAARHLNVTVMDAMLVPSASILIMLISQKKARSLHTIHSY